MKTTLLTEFVARNPRLSIALPDGLLSALERWAEAEGNKPTSLATFLLEKAIRDAIEGGKVPPESPKEESSKITPSELKAFLTQLAHGELPPNDQLLKLSHELGVETEFLMELRDNVHRSSNREEQRVERKRGK